MKHKICSINVTPAGSLVYFVHAPTVSAPFIPICHPVTCPFERRSTDKNYLEKINDTPTDSTKKFTVKNNKRPFKGLFQFKNFFFKTIYPSRFRSHDFRNPIIKTKKHVQHKLQS